MGVPNEKLFSRMRFLKNVFFLMRFPKTKKSIPKKILLNTKYKVTFQNRHFKKEKTILEYI